MVGTKLVHYSCYRAKLSGLPILETRLVVLRNQVKKDLSLFSLETSPQAISPVILHISYPTWR